MTIPSQPELLSRWFDHRIKTPNPASQRFISDPDHPDFWSHGNRLALAEIGVFSVDRPEHRAKREAERAEEFRIWQAYWRFNLNRADEHRKIEAKLEGRRFDGIWARSTAEYTAAIRWADERAEKAGSLSDLRAALDANLNAL